MSFHGGAANALVAAEILDKAAELIETHGLAKGVYEDTQKRLCTLGAMRNATDLIWATSGSDKLNTRTELLCVDAVKQMIRVDDACHIPHWNDAPHRTAEEVIDMLRHAAKNLRDEA